MVLWGKRFQKTAVALLCDNCSAMQSAISLKGKGASLQVAREMAWRSAQQQWQYAVAHLPKEQNQSADALSRLSAPQPPALPDELSEAVRVQEPSVAEFWKLQ